MIRPVFSMMGACALALSASPALARDSSAGNMPDFADRMNDPATQARIADAMSALTQALLAMPVGGFAEAMRKVDPDAAPGNIPRDATVRDMIGRDNPDLERNLDGKIRQGTRAAGAMAGAMAQMLPALKQAMRGVLEGMADGMDESAH